MILILEFYFKLVLDWYQSLLVQRFYPVSSFLIESKTASLTIQNVGIVTIQGNKSDFCSYNLILGKFLNYFWLRN